MITKKQTKKLAKDIAQGLRPELRGGLWNAFNMREWVEDPLFKGNPYFRALIQAGIIDEKGRLTEAGQWYNETINGLLHRDR